MAVTWASHVLHVPGAQTAVSAVEGGVGRVQLSLSLGVHSEDGGGGRRCRPKLETWQLYTTATNKSGFFLDL